MVCRKCGAVLVRVNGMLVCPNNCPDEEYLVIN